MIRDEMVLQKLVNWKRSREGRQILPISDEATGWTVRLTAERHDDLSCALWEIDAQRTEAAAQAGVSLRQWAEGIAARVTGLLEPLQLIEVDELRNEALLRSEEPSCRSEARFYYEIVLKGNRQALVRRYQTAKPGARREQVAFALTHEVLAHFVADLVAE